jgi:hypothetical protein
VNIIQKLLAAVRNWRRGVLVLRQHHKDAHAVYDESVTAIGIPSQPTRVDPRTANIRLLDHLIATKERQLRTAIKNGKERVSIRVALKKLQDERASLTGTL